MFDRSRTWVLDLFGLRDQRNKVLPTAGFSNTIGLLSFNPDTRTVYTGTGGYQLISPIFTIAGNTNAVQLLWRQLTGKGLSNVAFSKNGGAFTTVSSGTAFSSTFKDGDTLQIACNAFSISTGTATLRLENQTDGFAICSTTLTLTIQSGLSPG